MTTTQRFRVKVVPPCGDCHYFYADTVTEADRLVAELAEDLSGLSCSIWVYVDTRHGHVRIH